MRLLLLVTVAALASGCATLVRGPSESVTVDASSSRRGGADRDSAFVFVDGVAAGVAPARLRLARSRDHRVEVVRVGYRVARDTVERRFNPAVAAGSFLLGRLGSLGVDVSSGAVYDLHPSGMRVTLVPDSAGVEAGAVSDLVRRAQEAALDGFPRPEPVRVRRPGSRPRSRPAPTSAASPTPTGTPRRAGSAPRCWPAFAAGGTRYV